MNVVAIIVTWNGDKWIEKCLCSLKQSSIPVITIVIDNASSDQTTSIVKEKYPEVNLIETGSNLGFGKANNIGLRLAVQQNADFVFLLNQDAWVDKNTIENLVTIHHKNEAYGIVSPFHISGDNTTLEYKFIEYIQPNVCPGLVSDYMMNRLLPIYETTFVNAAAWLISKQCLLTVGGFDPLYPHYGEDTDYIQRAQYFGFKIGIVPQARIWHDSKILSWAEILNNRKRMLTIYFSEVKSISGSLRSNTLIFLKHRFDELTSHLLFRRFKRFAYHFGLCWDIVWQLRKISKARKVSKTKGAFL
jgi:GT2 family glycosyltransferase